jgi:hypothetical protein
MIDQVDYHIERINKKYIIDFLNSMFFAHAVLWDGEDQYNDLPIFANQIDSDMEKWEQRGALLVHKREQKALRLVITATKDRRQKVCFRLQSIKEPIHIDDHRKIYYPLDNVAIDFCISDLNLGVYEPTAYSFFDAAEKVDHISNKKLFSLIEFLFNCYFLSMDNKELFDDILLHPFSFPPDAIDEHYMPVFGVKTNGARDRS